MLEIWYQALSKPIGLVLETNNAVLCRKALYKAREEAKDRELMKLSVIISPTVPNQIWIIKTELIK